MGPQFVGHNAGQRGLAQTGRPGEQQVIGRLLTGPGRLQDDSKPFLEFPLAHEILQRAGPQLRFLDRILGEVDRLLIRPGSGIEEFVTRHKRNPHYPELIESRPTAEPSGFARMTGLATMLTLSITG